MSQIEADKNQPIRSQLANQKLRCQHTGHRFVERDILAAHLLFSL